MTAAEILCRQANTTQDRVCRKARIKRQSFQHLARNGKAHWNTAAKLSKILNCHPDVFLFGYEAHMKNEQRADETPGLRAMLPKL